MPLIKDAAINRLITRHINLQFQNVTSPAQQIEHILQNQAYLLETIYTNVYTADIDENELKDTIRHKLNERLQALLNSIEPDARITNIVLNRWNDVARNKYRHALPEMLEALMRNNFHEFSISLANQRQELTNLQFGLAFVNTDEFQNYIRQLIRLTNLSGLQNNPEIISLRRILENFLNNTAFDETLLQNILDIRLDLAPLPTTEQLGIISGNTSASENADSESSSSSEEVEIGENTILVITNASYILREYLNRIIRCIEIFQASRFLDLLERFSTPYSLSNEESAIANNVFAVYTDILHAMQRDYINPIEQTRNDLAQLIQEADTLLTAEHPVLQFAQALIDRGYCSLDMTLNDFRSDAEKVRILNNIAANAFNARVNDSMIQIRNLSEHFTQLLLQFGTRILHPANFSRPETNTLRDRTDARERALIQLLFDQMRLRYRAEIIPAYCRIQQAISRYHREHIAIFLLIGEFVSAIQEQRRKQPAAKHLTTAGHHRDPKRRDRDRGGDSDHPPVWQVTTPGGSK